MSGAWVTIDFETANEFRGSACAVGMARVRDGVVIDRWSTLIRPPLGFDYFSPFNMMVHGITPERVVSAPSFAQALAGIVRFADGQMLVAHNAAFDLGVIRDGCEASGLAVPELSYACSLVVSRRVWPQLVSHNLAVMARQVGHDLAAHHEAAADADAAAAVLIAAFDATGYTTVGELLAGLDIQEGRIWVDGRKGCQFRGHARKRLADLPEANPDADPDSPFYGLEVCLTGTVNGMTRAEAHERVANAGGQPSLRLRKSTDLLVAGGVLPSALAAGATKTSKLLKAEQFRAQGIDIEIITEHEFRERLSCADG